MLYRQRNERKTKRTPPGTAHRWHPFLRRHILAARCKGWKGLIFCIPFGAAAGAVTTEIHKQVTSTRRASHRLAAGQVSAIRSSSVDQAFSHSKLLQTCSALLCQFYYKMPSILPPNKLLSASSEGKRSESNQREIGFLGIGGLCCSLI